MGLRHGHLPCHRTDCHTVHRSVRIRQTEVRRLKRERSQHADFRDAEVMASTQTTALFKRAVRHRPQWASASDPVYGHLGN